MTKKILILQILSIFLIGNLSAQGEKETRINFLNPGLALEYPIGFKSTIEFNAGIGYNFSYPQLNTMYGENGWQWQLAPFLDVQARNYYNLSKSKEKSRKGANFIAFRYLAYGGRIAGNVRANENHSMAVGPTWGIKRTYGNLTFLTSVGPVYYFDLAGSSDILPFTFEVNLGYKLKKKSK